MNDIQKGITLLLRSGITGESLSLPEGFSLEEAFPVMKRHSIVSLAYQGAVNCGLDQTEPVMQKMLMHSLRVLMVHEKQARGVETLFAAFREAGIPFMPVKGCNIKKLYPKPEHRPMGDVDILIHLEDYPRIRPIMEQLGFSQIADTTHVYEWRSEALLVELHKSLVNESERDYYAYYDTGWQLGVPEEGSRFGLSREDAYIFTFVHFAKHYRGSGIGCRHVVDLYVCRKAWPDLDMVYVRGELEKLRLWIFHENVQRVLDTWFADGDPDPVTELITACVFSSGNWGTLEAGVYASESRKTCGQVRNSRFKAWIRAFFLPYETLAYNYPLLRRIPVLLGSVTDEGVLSYRQALEQVGLDIPGEE